MEFMEAVKAREQNKDVRRSGGRLRLTIAGEHYELEVIEKKDEIIYGWTRHALRRGDIKATDWEIIEEKKTLSDKIIYEQPKKNYIYAEDVKEKIKEYFNYVEYKGDRGGSKAIDIFGERLT